MGVAILRNMAEGTDSSTKRLGFKKQTLDDAYAVPANLLEIEICNPETHGLARNRYTDYEIKMKVRYDIVVCNNDMVYKSVIMFV